MFNKAASSIEVEHTQVRRMLARSPEFVKMRGIIKKLLSYFRTETCYSKEPSPLDGSFEHPNHMLGLMDKKIITILGSGYKFCFHKKFHSKTESQRLIIE